MNEPSPPPSQEAQLRALLAAMEAANRGDLTHRLPVQGTHPLLDQLAQAFNAGVTIQATVAAEVMRVAHEVGTEGRLGGQIHLPSASGVWKTLTDSVNLLADSLTTYVRDMTRVATAVAHGEVGHKLALDVRGESLVLKTIINTMVDRLSEFGEEVNRVSREVGTEGMLGSVAEPHGMSGIWKELSANVNATEQLALASRHKSEFLANMSHELRTPLNSLLILAKVLSENKEHRLGPREVEYAKTIHTSGTDLLNLVNEILDLSKVEAGKMRIAPDDVPLADVKAFVERSFAPVAEQKGLGFSVSLDAGLPASIHTDPQRLQQVLKNLLSNAFKFTGSGRVELRITPVEGQHKRFDSEVLNRSERVMAFSVKDSGIGIPPDKQKLIFEAFQQADSTTSREYGGTGLGLSISLAMTRLLCGELHVDSQPGQGSTFTLYLPERYLHTEDSTPAGEARPVVDLPSLPPPSKPSPDPSRSLAGLQVLIVDDDIRNAFALTSALEARGLRALYAENGKVGLEALLNHHRVDAVIMDMVMPEMDGYAAMRAIRQDPRFATLPIIALTAQALPEDRDKCLAAGASDYLPKPADTDQLLELLRRWCR
ncbi:ATP-binding protein [Hyalangium versicolor]|uniref:ATP-binding protein n=1 Tax=Hyalangium versicolor TaxID=2861190 RepID=UPI001CCB6B63|nr:ATP-binding protein [Hyalangium versicolor]